MVKSLLVRDVDWFHRTALQIHTRNRGPIILSMVLLKQRSRVTPRDISVGKGHLGLAIGIHFDDMITHLLEMYISK
jgi:hypothetical protein